MNYRPRHLRTVARHRRGRLLRRSMDGALAFAATFGLVASAVLTAVATAYMH